ncbi:hypothetical protein GCM10010191_73510 [Actinomadura vinacea]|uniref:Glycosyltransferase family 2 protein n=1 Tax=Actinomadura vinacea TaxID=115336 RepID=A0ABP5X5D6_9ACTN
MTVQRVSAALWGRAPSPEAVARAEARRLAGPPRTRAVLTIARDESVFLPIWLRYYSRFFAPSDIYVLDHGSTDGSADGPGFVRIPVRNENVDVLWVRDAAQEHQHRLIEGYDAVLYADADEIVVPHPRLGTLADYLDRFHGRVARCTGYELIHLRDREAPFDPARPVLEQRGHWFPNPLYGKPALARVPVTWGPGFHTCREADDEPDPDLFLLHLHRLDYDRCLDRHRARAAKPWSRVDLERGWYHQMRITEEPHFRRWFYGDTGTRGEIPMRIEPIPEFLRGLF